MNSLNKIYLLLLLLPILLVIKPTESSAFSVTSINDIGTVQTGDIYYHSGNDEIRIEFAPQRVYSTIHAFNPPTGTVRNNTASTGTWIVASGFTCVGTYDFTAKDANGDIVLTMTIVIEEGDLVAPKCDSGNAGDTSPTPEECGTVVCECIEQLKTVLHGDLQSISQSINEGNTINQNNGTKLDSVNNNLSDLKVIATDIKNEIVSLHDEFETDIDYTVKPLPSTSNLLEDNKPVQPTTTFTDSTIYFEDMGDAETPGKLPTTPEPVHWEGFLPEDALPPEEEQSKESEYLQESELESETENTLDVFNQDLEMPITPYTQDLEMIQDVQSQDAPLIQEDFTQSPVLEIEDIQQTETFTQTEVYTQTNVFP